MNFFKFLFLLICVFCLAPFATAAVEDTQQILSFKDWKGSQVLEAKNQVVRLSNRITLLKKGILKDETSESEEKKMESADVSSDRIKTTTQKDLIGQTEAQLKSALENLQFTTELSLQDYFAVYLSRFKDQPDLMSRAADKLSKEEVLELLKTMLKSEDQQAGGSDNASHIRGALVDGLVTTTR